MDGRRRGFRWLKIVVIVGKMLNKQFKDNKMGGFLFLFFMISLLVL